jgi:hypothetical protein
MHTTEVHAFGAVRRVVEPGDAVEPDATPPRARSERRPIPRAIPRVDVAESLAQVVAPYAVPPPVDAPQLPAFEGDFDPVRDIAWQRIWLALERTEWSSLALVPVADDFNVYRSARALAAVGGHHLRRPVDAFNATVVELGGLAHGLRDLALRGTLGRRSIIALPSILTDPIALAIARAADVCLVCLRLGDRIDDAAKTIEEIGVERVVGTVLVHRRDAAH